MFGMTAVPNRVKPDGGKVDGSRTTIQTREAELIDGLLFVL
jgi:hypothetical protein